MHVNEAKTELCGGLFLRKSLGEKVLGLIILEVGHVLTLISFFFQNKKGPKQMRNCQLCVLSEF